MFYHIAIFVLLWAVLSSATTIPLRLMTFNIDCRLCDKHLWHDRLPGLKDTLSRYSPDIIGIQETMFQEDVTALLKDLEGYSAVCPELEQVEELAWDACILYSSRFQVESSDSFWLGPNPDKPGDYDLFNLPRIATYALIKDTKTGESFYFGSTHFDHGDNTDDGIKPSSNECVKMSEQLVAFTEDLASEKPFFWTCDCNSHYDTNAFAILTNETASTYLVETWDLSEATQVVVGEGQNTPDYDHHESIDHIFLAQTETYKPTLSVSSSFVDMVKYPCLQRMGSFCKDEEMAEGIYASDHYAIVTDLELFT